MEDLVDYSKGPLEGTSIQTYPQVNSIGLYPYGCDFVDTIASLPLISRFSCSVITLSKASPSLPDLTAQPMQLSTLKFVDQTLEPSFRISSEGLTSSQSFISSHVPLASLSNDPTSFTPRNPVLPSTRTPPAPSGNITQIPPISSVFPSKHHLENAIPESNPPQGDPQTILPDEIYRKGKEPRVLKLKAIEVFLHFDEEIQWSEVMDTVDHVLVGRIRGQSYNVARLKQWVTKVWEYHLAEPLFVQTFVKGWFVLRIARAQHTNWVL